MRRVRRTLRGFFKVVVVLDGKYPTCWTHSRHLHFRVYEKAVIDYSRQWPGSSLGRIWLGIDDWLTAGGEGGGTWVVWRSHMNSRVFRDMPYQQPSSITSHHTFLIYWTIDYGVWLNLSLHLEGENKSDVNLEVLESVWYKVVEYTGNYLVFTVMWRDDTEIHNQLCYDNHYSLALSYTDGYRPLPNTQSSK